MTKQAGLRELDELHFAERQNHAQPKLRLEPIEKPDGLMLRLAYWMLSRQFGRVPTSVKVIVARVPRVMKVMGAARKFEENGTQLDKELRNMIGMVVSEANGCGFCLDIGRMFAVKDGVSLQKLDALPEYQTSPLFADRERAALAYAEEVTRNRHVAHETFDELRKYFSDREIVEITILTALQNLANLVNIPLGIDSDGLCAIAQSKKQ
jgi:AhpD family alkylhydroperoxidase